MPACDLLQTLFLDFLLSLLPSWCYNPGSSACRKAGFRKRKGIKMSINSVKHYLKAFGRDGDVQEFSVSSATVELAAQAVGTLPARIAKTLAFYSQDRTHAILVVTAGDQKIDNSKFKHFFGMKARMLAREDVEAFTGHGVGGVCPFANPEGAQVYLDISMKRFPTVFPAAGSDNSAIQLTCSQLEQLSHSIDWIDVCKPMQE